MARIIDFNAARPASRTKADPPPARDERPHGSATIVLLPCVRYERRGPEEAGADLARSG